MADELAINPLYGASLGGTWVPAPRYVLRRSRILSNFDHLPRGSVIEVGCGAGGILRDLTLRGFNCTGVDSSPAAREVASRMMKGLDGAHLVPSLHELQKESFDYLLSCEVLEHIYDDRTEFQKWLTFLKPGGLVIVAVPAHQESFGPLDKWAGHVRRYDRDQLMGLLDDSGIKLVKLECYGFPMANITSFVRNQKLARTPAPRSSEALAAATAKSGIDRAADMKIYGFQTSFAGQLLMRTALVLQNLFLSTNLGDGFLSIGRKER